MPELLAQLWPQIFKKMFKQRRWNYPDATLSTYLWDIWSLAYEMHARLTTVRHRTKCTFKDHLLCSLHWNYGLLFRAGKVIYTIKGYFGISVIILIRPISVICQGRYFTQYHKTDENGTCCHVFNTFRYITPEHWVVYNSHKNSQHVYIWNNSFPCVYVCVLILESCAILDV